MKGGDVTILELLLVIFVELRIYKLLALLLPRAQFVIYASVTRYLIAHNVSSTIG